MFSWHRSEQKGLITCTKEKHHSHSLATDKDRVRRCSEKYCIGPAYHPLRNKITVTTISGGIINPGSSRSLKRGVVQVKKE